MTNSPLKLLSPSELAEILNVRIGWVYDRTRQNGPETLPHYKLGKYLRFKLPEILEYLDRQSRVPNARG